MLLEIILDFNCSWEDIIFYVVCAIGCLFALAAIPQDFWHYFFPFIVIGLMFIGVVTYIIWYLTSYKAGWYDLSYLATFGIGVGITIAYFVIYSIVDKILNK